MNRSKFLSYLLLGYLGLFLNLGPAIHRAPMFGLHDHAFGKEHLCECGRDHPRDTGQSDASTSMTLPACDCSLCTFFKHYNAAFDFENSENSSVALWSICPVVMGQVDAIYSATFARGPPTS